MNVRRLFIALEASIYKSTQWVVFEPNDPRVWARVKQSITLFLRAQWRKGALFGQKEEEAFIVSVGRETMTEDDILNGRLIVGRRCRAGASRRVRRLPDLPEDARGQGLTTN